MGGWTALLLSATLGPLAPPALPVDDRASLEHYAHAVELYRLGQVEAALEAVGQRPERSLRLAADRAAELLRAHRSPGFSVPAAVLLHTDQARLERERGQREAEVFHLDLARRLASAATGLPELAGFCRRYFLAAAHAWQLGEDWGLARDLLDSGLKLFPGDAPLLVARAAMEETLAAFGEADEGPPRPLVTGRKGPPRQMRQAAASRQRRLEALALLRRAVAAAPESEEARLRLGRVLLETGDTKGGLALLDELRSARDPELAYLAWLLRGGALARSGRLPEALESYRAALALEPRGQVAHLALARALDESGLPGASAEVAEGLAVVTREPAFADPWWTYHFRGDDLLAPLREETWR